MKIIFTGGGTGGHIFPIIAIVRELRKLQFGTSLPENLDFFYIGPKDYFSQIFLSEEEIKFKSILTGKIRRYFTPFSFLENLFDVFFKIPLGILQAFFYLFFLSPDLIFSKGGYGSWPVVISGWILGIPIFLHESDIVPGLANKIISHFSSLVFVSFPKTEYFPLQKMLLVGNPIRREILEGSKEEAKDRFNLISQKPLILILGGSQGAQRINDLILEILPNLLENYQIIHQSGEQNFKQVEAESKVIISEEEKDYHLFGFLNERDLGLAYQAADLVVSRAGSGSIFEIAATGKPSILIPLPEAAQGHQLKNAYAFSLDGHRALVIEEANLTPHFFLERLNYLFSHPREMAEMARKAKEFSHPESAKIVSQYIIDYLFK